MAKFVVNLRLVHMGPKFSIPSHLSSICAILVVESMNVGTYHYLRGPKVLSPTYDMDA